MFYRVSNGGTAESGELIDEYSVSWSGTTSGGYSKILTYPKDGIVILTVVGLVSGSAARFDVTHSSGVTVLHQNNYWAERTYSRTYKLQVHSGDTTTIAVWGYGNGAYEGYVAYYC